MFLKIGCKTKA